MKQKHKDKFTDDEFIESYNRTPYMTHLAVEFGVPDITIFRRAKRLGLEFKNGGWTGKFTLSDILEGKHPQYPTGKLKYRLIKEKILKEECNICGISEWNNKSLTLHLDHEDGNSHNHALSNLRLLCPNCHSQTDTYCGRNKIRSGA